MMQLVLRELYNGLQSRFESTKSPVWRANVLACLACLRTHVLTVCILSMLACFMSLRAHMSCMFAVLIYLRYLSAFVLGILVFLCNFHLKSIFFLHFKFQKFLYRRIWLLAKGVFRTHLSIYEGVTDVCLGYKYTSGIIKLITFFIYTNFIFIDTNLKT